MNRRFWTLTFAFFVLLLNSLANAAIADTYIKLGSIGDDPAKRIRKHKPIIDYLAKHIRTDEIVKGKVVVAADIHQMIDFIKAEKVDIFIDSPYPVVVVSKYSNTKFLLSRWKKGVEKYHTVIFTRKDSGVNQLEDLKGKLIAFENPWSTSGYFLPKASMEHQGIKTVEKSSRNAMVKPDEVGYLFSDGDETSMIWVLRNIVAAGATDNLNFVEDAKDRRDQLRIVHETDSVPRQVVSYREGLSPTLVKDIEKVLLSMHLTEEGGSILKSYSKTKKFEKLSPGFFELLNNLKKAVSID